MTVVSPDRDSYEILIREKDYTITEVYTLQLFRLGGTLFYDLAFSRVELNGEQIRTGDISVLPGHSFGRIWIHPDEVRIGNLNKEWLAKTLSERKVQLSYEYYGEHDILLTGPPEKVRAFAQQYADDKDAFSGTSEFRKQN